MGVQGLKFQLARHGKPEVITLLEGGATGLKAGDDTLLVDGASLQSLFAEAAAASAGGMRSKDPIALQYKSASHFLAGILRTGLKLHVILDGRDASQPAAVLLAAVQAAKVPFTHSQGAPEPLMLAWLAKNRESVFGVMTSNTDYFVYGVRRIAVPIETVVDPASVTFQMWPCDQVWSAWRVHREPSARGVSLLQRGQVAAMLGREDPEDAGPHKGAVPISSPIIAAELSFSYEYDLPLSFFQKDLGMKKFTEEDLAAFNAIAATYVAAAEGAASADPSALAGPAPAGLPAVDAAAVAMAAAAIGEADAAAGAAAPTLQISVGSSLSSADWDDIDHKDVVAKTKASSAYKIMLEVQPFEPSIRGGAAALRQNAIFDYFYSKRKEDGPWKKLAKACFAEKYETISNDKELKKEADKISADDVMMELKKAKGEGAPTIKWLETLARATASDLLELQRQALAAGCNSVQWGAWTASWAAATDRTKEEAMELMYTCLNKPSPFGKPMRYKHQEEIMNMVDKHLTKIEGQGKTPLPLHVILSTPTGSGKTFTAVMMHLQMLREAHEDAVLIYSVPTKMVLKRVGQECEAHNTVYWTAAMKDQDLYQVRRPYSIRTKREKKRGPEDTGPLGAGSGTIKAQLEAAMAKGKEMQDRGNGRPSIIVADIHATAALLEEAKNEPTSSFFHPTKIVLYLDEPNMGVHLDPTIRAVVSKIMCNAPLTTILASATLPTWDKLPSWWKGGGLPATRTVITQPPHSLPMSNLSVMDEDSGIITQVSPLQLFRSYDEFSALFKSHPQLRVLLLRHLTSKQGRGLLPACMLDPKDSMAVQGDVRTLRETLELELGRLNREKFDELVAKWKGAPNTSRKVARGVIGALSTTGVTMIATIDPRRCALELCGKGNEEAWMAEVHKVKNKRKDAARVAKEAEKAAARRKRDDEDDRDGGGGASGVELRNGLLVTVEEAEDADEDTLVMLSKGIAYATADGTEDLVKRLYQEALLHVPEGAKRLPPIHTLVVDYSSVYGTDCPAVDTIIMLDDLGKHLTWEDHQQFLGRLRRDGQAIFMSMRTLRRAAIGVADSSEMAEDIEFQRAVQAAVLGGMGPLEEEVARLAAAVGIPKAAGAGALLHSILALALPAPAHITDEAMRAKFPEPKGLVNGLKQELKPAEAAKAFQSSKAAVAAMGKVKGKGEAAERRLLEEFESFVVESGVHAGAGGKAYFALVPQALKILYDLDLVGEDALLAWRESRKGMPGGGPGVGGRAVATQAGPFLKWLEEAESDSGEEESDDDEE